METEHPVSDDWTPKRSRWPLVVLAVLLAGGAAFAWWWFTQRVATRIDRVVVAVRSVSLDGASGAWWDDGDRVSERIAASMTKPLERYGLEVAQPADELVKGALKGAGDDELRAAAARAGAGLLLTGTVRTVRALPLTGAETTDYTVEVTLTLSETGEGAAPMAVLETPLVMNVAAASEDRARLEVAEEAPDLILPALAAALVGIPAVAKVKPGATGLTNEELALATKLEPAFRAASYLRSERERRAEEEATARAEDQKDEKGRERHLIGEFFAEEYVVDVLPDGRLVLLTEPHYVDVAQSAGAYGLRRGNERLVLADADGGERSLLAEVYNVFSFPGVSKDGRWVAAVTDHRGWAKSLDVFEIATGKRTELAQHDEHYFSGPQPSPDGSLVAFWYRTCRRCASSLDVIGRDGSGRKTLLEANDGESRSAVAWSTDGKRLYLSRELVGERSSVWAIDVADGSKRVLLAGASEEEGEGAEEEGEAEGEAEGEEGEGRSVAVRSSFDDPVVSPDGTWLCVLERTPDGIHIGRLDLATEAWSRIAAIRAQDVVISPDGRTIAFETWRTDELGTRWARDLEVAVVPVAGGEPKLLTDNDEDDELRGWSPDGKRVYLHQSSKDPSGKRYTNRVWWVAP